jgi:UDP:flavonoid glycosyltransferase YjiC (YdhE family)
MARIVLNTFGSLGDLHPYVAIALELKRRGHQPVVATHGLYRERVEALGLEFAPVRPNGENWDDPAGVIREAMDAKRGSEVVLKKLVLPYLREGRDDLLEAARGADLIVDHVLAFAAPLVAASLHVPRVSTTLQPLAMFSRHDPPVNPSVPWLRPLRNLGPAAWGILWWLARLSTQGYFRELTALRREMSLPATNAHPMFDGASAELHLVLFSPELAGPQPDWPASAVQTGFPVHDRGEAGERLPLALDVFLRQGTPPIVFTLGSSAIFAADGFYVAAAQAARALGRRAVLMTGDESLNPVPGVPPVAHAPAGAPIVTVPYAPHSEVMPRACAVVHQGGVGTTAQAMLAGRPMLVVPFSHDQPDNADRLRRKGVARVLERSRVTAEAFTRELAALLADEPLAARAQAMALRMKQEPGAAGAADAIEALLVRSGRVSGHPARTGRVAATSA